MVWFRGEVLRLSARLWKGSFCVFVFAVYAVLGLSSFHLEGLPRRLANGVEALSGGGVRFRSPGMARTPRVPEWLGSAIQDSTIEVEVEARASVARQCGPARIFTVSRNTSSRDLTIAQEGSDLIVRLRLPSTSPNGLPP